jgi:glycosyltransferase involved in cell wall biosynthesis
MDDPVVDVCLLSEGSYPYLKGGVSMWMHELMLMHPHLTFHVVSIIPENMERKNRFEPAPENLKGITDIIINFTTEESSRRFPSEVLAIIKENFSKFALGEGSYEQFVQMIHALEPHKERLQKDGFIHPEDMWEIIQDIYHEVLPTISFLNSYWSLKSLLTAILKILFSPVPRARIYHPICTGYTGLLATRCHIETQSPMVLTEHGIYTNERRIELGSIDWLDDKETTPHYTIDKIAADLNDLWINMFTSFSKVCYEGCERIVTLYTKNQEMQEADGAQKEKLQVIPNGIDYDGFHGVYENTPLKENPVVALIGRVVPIKDIKTYIRAAKSVCDEYPNVSFLTLGTTEEDPGYYEECKTMVEEYGIAEQFIFTGNVNLKEYLPRIDLLVLSSISEAQPLVILEAGAAGVPTVSTDVGCCHELLYGGPFEDPPLGQSGVIVPVSNATALADGIKSIILSPEKHQLFREVILKRVETYYHKEIQRKSYRDLYDHLLKVGAEA